MENREVRMRCLEAAAIYVRSKEGIASTVAGALTTAREFENYVIGAESPKPGQPVLTGLGARAKDAPSTRT